MRASCSACPPTALLLLLILAACSGPSSSSREVGEIRLAGASASSGQIFSRIAGVRERADGSVVTVDPIEQRVDLLDRDLGWEQRVGVEGAGPDEYATPDAVYALPGDSTLIVDLANARLAVLDEQLVMRTVIPLILSDVPDAPAGALLLVAGTDATGRLYFSMRLGRGDSTVVMRLDRRDGSITRLARLRGTPVDRVGDGRDNNPVRMRRRPYAGADGWATTPDGGVFVIRATPPAVEYLAQGSQQATTLVGDPQLIPVAIGAAERAEYLDEMRRGGEVRVGMEMRGGERRLSGVSRQPSLDTLEASLPWPVTKPWFDPSHRWVDATGVLWLRLATPAGLPWRYARLSAGGARLPDVLLPPDRRVVGMGASSVYLAHGRPDGTWRLERWDLPVPDRVAQPPGPR